MLDEVQKALRDRRLDIVAAATGLSRQTIADIRDGANRNPTLATLQKLIDYLKTTNVKDQ